MLEEKLALSVVDVELNEDLAPTAGTVLARFDGRNAGDQPFSAC